MAANKFATMLHRNTNKISMILIYAVLEWTLIVLLLVNSLFSYLIIKFAQYFGLKPPCIWCSRLDHIFAPGKDHNMHRDLLCDAHAKEISKLGYCSNHQKLAASHDMCEDCLSSTPEFYQVSKSFAFFGTIHSDDAEQKVVENGIASSSCSCCGVEIENKFLPQIVIKPWDFLEYAKKGEVVEEAGEDDHYEQGNNSDGKKSDVIADGFEFENKDETQMVFYGNGDFSVTGHMEVENTLVLEDREKENADVVLEERKEDITMKDQAVQVSVGENAPVDLEFLIDCTGHQLVPIELMDKDDQQSDPSGPQFHEEGAKFGVPVEVWCREGGENAEYSVHMNLESKLCGFESIEIEEDETSLVFYAKGCSDREVTITRVEETPSQDSGDVQGQEAAEDEEKRPDIDGDVAGDDSAQVSTNETDGEVSIGTEIPDLDLADEIQEQTDPSTSSLTNVANGHDLTLVHESTIELSTLTVEINREIEDEKVPDTPTSVDSLNHLHKRLLLLEKKDSGTEDSLDGSIVSELEGVDGTISVERLKTALRSGRKALQALYAELEEERNASAISANQTMAMINRLQEEKAAMQMEALQYQRMMEEQAEYDQEALQLLNELMVKREKEKEELEKELEIYRKKVLEYETRENLRMLRKRKDGNARSGFSSPSCSDAASIDLNQEVKEEDGYYGNGECYSEHTPVNAVLNLEDSIADFEEERSSILEQLKALEKKLMSLDDEELNFEDVKPIEHFEENGNHIGEDGHVDGLANGHANGFHKEMNGEDHPEGRSFGPKGKSLLTLFDAANDENGESTPNGSGNEFDSNGVHGSTSPKLELENRRLAIEEELDHLYERLQALEADREFLKHCIGSLKKGGKGIHLLHEILQQLKDLRNVELRARSLLMEF